MMQIAWMFIVNLSFNPLHFMDADRLIVNGSSCNVSNHPYLIRHFMKYVHENGTIMKTFDCGGSLVKPNVVLTAAHCCNEVTSYPRLMPDTFYAYSSVVRMGDNPEFEQIREGREYKVHPNYNYRGVTYDLCLLKLSEGFHLTERTQLVKLATPTLFNAVLEGKKYIEIIGYGSTWSSSKGGLTDDSNETLQCARNKVMSMNDCSERLKLIGESQLFKPSIAFCTLPNITRSTTCHGDSGGPALYDGIQVGVVCGGASACGPEPAFFTRVDSELEFITKGFKNSVQGMFISPMLYVFIFFVNIF